MENVNIKYVFTDKGLKNIEEFFALSFWRYLKAIELEFIGMPTIIIWVYFINLVMSWLPGTKGNYNTTSTWYALWFLLLCALGVFVALHVKYPKPLMEEAKKLAKEHVHKMAFEAQVNSEIEELTGE